MTTEPAAQPRPDELPARPAPPDPGREPVVVLGPRHLVAVGIAVFVSGAVLLGLEIAASRVVAPYFGSSLFVWGSLIGVVLTGLSIGYWLGGALADRLPATRLLLSVMALAALLVLAVPVVDDTVLRWVVAWDAGPRANPFIAAVALFGIPSVVFAAVTPIAVRLVSQSVTSVGRTAGRLFAISTAGSIAGTFATAFFLIPAFGTNQLLALAAATLFGAIVLVAIVERLLVPAGVGVLGAALAVVAALNFATPADTRLTGAAAENWSPVYRERGEAGVRVDHAEEGFRVALSRDTQYHRLAVVEDTDSRYLRFDNSFQSGMYVDRPYATRFAYSDFFHLGRVYRPQADSLLMVGLGGGSAMKRLSRDFPGMELKAVEIDPVVVEVAREHFALPPEVDVEVDDGRRYLLREERRWDVIGLDAYYSDSIPFHLATREFLELVRDRLEPGGVVVANVIGALEGPGSRLFRSFYKTYREVFPTVVVHPVIESEVDTDPSSLRNIMLVATEGAAPSTEFLLERWQQMRPDDPESPDLRDAIGDRYEKQIPTGDVPILTDDYAPTDALLLFDG
ncbi:MAG TPA: fused MFS/spermidine synthase [Gaiellaceae bacterium]|nr:fused MFS/spermidine synthase [Gaiellaceae bacterium]